ncbi:XdhC/CoxI family protein [Actinocorallia sp. A-T 12471]|uniref:XdhC family protein n=1 Tax=Actinocorallia sp. A-T 12471 TaxID=3089813 RepID=UPI0029D1E512|nr:XdhC/CoxI family protein [Actinocorallia sp. A-T 12471]MDX6744886.1 XdhC/CoxI family protein [Actinocorallia sp. A-T 12471]
MREIAETLLAWSGRGVRYALATVVGVGGSAPRPPGAAMAVAETGEAVGGVSGGCVEGAVYELCRQVLRTGVAVRETFGYADDTAFAVGLTCGGTVEVSVHPAPPHPVLKAATGPPPVAIAHVLTTSGTPPTTTPEGHVGSSGAPLAVTPEGRGDALGATLAVTPDGHVGGAGAVLVITPEGHVGGTGEADVDAAIVAEARAMLAMGVTGVRAVHCRPGLEVFVVSAAARPRLLVFGAIDHAAAVASLGGFLGYRVTVCDARPVFATRARFPDADEVVVDWPHRYLAATPTDARTAVVVLTHDPKFDLPLLEVALRLPVGYVGAMGSRRTHAERLARLREAGLTDAELARLRSPIGLDLGGRTPEETALAIAAEIVAARHGATAAPLHRTTGPLHHDMPVTAG